MKNISLVIKSAFSEAPKLTHKLQWSLIEPNSCSAKNRPFTDSRPFALGLRFKPELVSSRDNLRLETQTTEALKPLVW